MLDAAVWNHDGYSGCTTWKLVDTMVWGASRLFVLLFPKWPQFFLSFWGLPPTDCWLNNSHMSQLYPEWLLFTEGSSDRAFVQGCLMDMVVVLPEKWRVRWYRGACVCFFFSWVTMVLPLLSRPSTHWLLTEHFPHVSQLFPEWLVYKRKESVTEPLYKAALAFRHQCCLPSGSTVDKIDLDVHLDGHFTVCLPKQIPVIRASSPAFESMHCFVQTQQCLSSPILCSSMFMCCKMTTKNHLCRALLKNLIT